MVKGYDGYMSDTVVIIVNFNGLQDTVEAVNSVYDSNVDVDVIVVDNASADGEAEMLRKQLPRIILLTSKVNLGFSGGNNIGIKYALDHGYEFIMLLNNDTIISYDMVERLKSRSSDTVVTVPTIYYYYNREAVWYAGGEVNYDTGYVVHSYQDKKMAINELQETDCSFASGCCFMIKASTLKKCGLLSEIFFMYCEDTDYSIRLKKNEIKIRYLPEAVMWHKVSQSTKGEESQFSVYYNNRNRLYLVYENKECFSWKARIYTSIRIRYNIVKYWAKRDKKYKALYKALYDFKHGIKSAVDLSDIS